MTSGPESWHLAEVLEAAEAASPVAAVEAVTARVARFIHAVQVRFLIADLSGRAMIRLSVSSSKAPADTRSQGTERAEPVSVDDASVARALETQTTVVDRPGQDWRLLAPVTQRGEVIGLLEVLVADEPTVQTSRLVGEAAHILAYVVIANRRHTDLFEWGQRSAPYQLSAEIQRRLLPAALTCEASAFTLASWLEPAATIAGDTFDYSLERDTLHFSMTDAMGHGVGSALTATLGVSALRNARRQGQTLEDQAAAANTAVAEHAPHRFLTGLLGRINLKTGMLSVVNAGHTPPLLHRDTTVEELHFAINLPFGIAGTRPYEVTRFQLQPRDRLVVFTDGMTERAAEGLDLPQHLGQFRDHHPREAVRELADAVLDLSGHVLSDDAAVLIIDWTGGHVEDRDTYHGANRDHNS